MLFSKPKENKTEDGKMFDMRKIGKRIAELRKSKNITQMALADMMGISFQAVSNWERGESMPDISKLGELSEIFGVSIDDILCNKRAAEIVEEISAGEKPSDITPEELTETVPLMAPEQAEESIKENKEKMTFSQLASLAPFMNEDDLGEMAKEAAKNGGTLEDIAVLAAFMNEDDLGEIAEEAIKNGGTLEDVANLAPFMSEDDLGAIAKEAIKNGGTLEDVANLAAFISGDDLGAIAKEAIKSGGSLEDIAALAPFMNDDDIKELAKEKLKSSGKIEDIAAFAPFMDEDDIGEIIKHMISK
ncbi:MAG: helix-turn-helix domain-containing protein [Eubacteriales bacterium]|nr:helix-turn-helix domain-containing protein [Eubacteriales bacterium]